jgi:hypothetical protein
MKKYISKGDQKMKTINLAALKKNLKKEPLNYYIAPEKIFLWDKQGFFAFIVNHLVFESEILPNIPTVEQPELPMGIKKVMIADTNDYNIITPTLFYIELANSKNPVKLFKCYNRNYIIPINSDFYKMLNYPEEFTILQAKENAPVHFINDAITIIIMPIHNKGIIEKLQDIAGGNEK